MSGNYAIILAAGKGLRMKAGINKQYIDIDGKPILYYTLKAFSKCQAIDNIIVVASESEINYCKKEVVDKYGFNKVSKIVAGGNERQESVLKGLEAISSADIVLIHDGARPFVEENTIKQGIEYARLYGAAASGVPSKDTVKVKDENGFSKGTLKRSELFLVQTPQVFKYDLILKCHHKLKEENMFVTDDTMVVERYGYRVYLYQGSYDNIKITTPEDLVFGENLIYKLHY
ncbi:2-C-methyl-D-erythritol 4-phosphate cytidylyltransferase [Haloimpatiens sp. FM7315]|uniref:2-C-methyl-D-erythritol 4-phosphate cytidylyltransferase n=1 Tax=Haloimpatiens sp. FM7315 TaxID=3298609 RepID=UPI00370B705E